MSHRPPEQIPDRRAQLLGMLSSIWLPRALFAAAELRLADHLYEGPLTTIELAQKTHTDPGALSRLLRALATVEVVSESDGHYSLGPSGTFLRSNSPESLHSVTLTLGGDWQWGAWSKIIESLRTGQSGMIAAHGQSLFDYLRSHADHGRTFDEAMTALYTAVVQTLPEKKDFSKVASVLDIGGGQGDLITAVLKRYPKLEGGLFDLPTVAQTAIDNIQRAGVSERCKVLSGDFFADVPKGYDVHVLAHVLHDWDDADAERILRKCRQALDTGGQLLIVEAVIPPDAKPHHSKSLDLLMLVVTGGKERTAAEYINLLNRTGFQVSKFTCITPQQHLIEAVAR